MSDKPISPLRQRMISSEWARRTFRNHRRDVQIAGHRPRSVSKLGVRGALAAPQCGAIRAAVGPAGKKPPQAGEGTPRITRARTLGASAVRSRRASVPAFGAASDRRET